MVDLSKYPISQTRRAGNLVFISGQLPIGADGALQRGDIRAQTRLTIENLEKALATAGCSLANVVKVTTWLSDKAHGLGYNETYAELFSDPYPTRSTLVSELMVEADIEMEAVAVAIE